MKKLCDLIDKLITYAGKYLELPYKNTDFVVNNVSHLLGVSGHEFHECEVTESLDALLDGLVRECIDEGLITEQQREDVCDGVMGCLILPPDRVQARFDELLAAHGSEAATKWLYDYSVHSYYVRKKALDANPRFDSCGLVVTINKSKPEFRDPKNAVSGNAVKGGYPKCSICHSNEGFAGRNKRTLRTIDITLDGEWWFWQFSPYGYFAQHGIAVNYEHIPMHVDESTFVKLMDFVDLFPHYFIGCNAALERIGGSVLAHDHFQGGGEILPMHRAGAYCTLYNKQFPDTVAEVLDWEGTVVRLVSRDRDRIRQASYAIADKWVHFTDESRGIVAHDEQGTHNAVSPTVVKTPRGYEMNIILRSNITSERYPDGVFHAHPEFHAIKKESIGLIEAQGLFILPGRLERELGQLCELLQNREPLPSELETFRLVYDETLALTEEQGLSVHEAMRRELGSICKRILQNTAVFKDKRETVEFMRELRWTH